MNEKTLEMLSAYLDDQLNQEQKEEIEKLINEDTQIRHEYEEMKAFSLTVSASRPLDVVAPEAFRSEIISKLQTHLSNDGNQGGTSGGSSSILKNKWLGYLAAGSVLVGLTSWFVYQDNQNQQKINILEQVKNKAVDVKNDMEIEMPEYKGKSKNDSNLEQVAASDIKNIERDASQVGLENKDELLQGEIYSRGHGKIRYTNESEDLLHQNEKNSEVESENIEESKDYLKLESRNDWTRKNVELTLKTKNITKKLSAKKCMTLAEKYNLNPGVIISLAELDPEKDTTEQVKSIRQILNKSGHLADEERLDKIVKQFNGSDDWKKIIKNNLQP